jgi:hypothetical protein
MKLMRPPSSGRDDWKSARREHCRPRISSEIDRRQTVRPSVQEYPTQRSRLQQRSGDRVRYLTDVVSIFEELQIPWQQWFMIMDKSGVVVPEYSAAMRLGQ